MSLVPTIVGLAATGFAALCAAGDGAVLAPDAEGEPPSRAASRLAPRDLTHRALVVARLWAHLVAGLAFAIALGRERVASVARAVLRAEGARRASLSIAFVSNRRIAALNRRHLGHAGPTDVISFALAPAVRGEVQGDIYIAPDVARDNALEHGVPVREELARLVVHGTLHVLGHEHPEGPARERSPLWRRQEALLRRTFHRASARPDSRRAGARRGAR